MKLSDLTEHRLVHVKVWLMLALAIFSCSRNVTMNRLMPADITVPSHVQRILIVDRTEPESQGLAIIEGILTGEAPFEVKNAVESTIATITQELNTSPRYEIIRARERLKGGLFAQTFPQPLSWELIDRLVKQYDADAVLSLEMFSSDFIVTDKAQLIKKTVGSGENAKEVEVQGFYAEGIANVKAGFRFYDPVNRNLFDQKEFSKTNTWSATAESRGQALALLIDKSRATIYVGQMAGASYARRVAPMYLNISRTYYPKSKKNPQIERGARYAQVNQWEEAIATWESGLPSAHPKTGGRMAYNIALGYEVLGDLQNAKYWADLAYLDYGFKNARAYSQQLDRRMGDEERLRYQMGEAQ
ncbi:DUF6340 family protein [Pararhodonellum marinum]|uniref:DUF6340 family protein n=1 Tax=Pararhodonellum marinum TaxID=2755358 RepID=UPI001E31EE70|nr:DUF6340 family protein [Pararhodonellum marinum]